MRITRKVLASLDQVYSIALIPGAGDGAPAFVAGSETDHELLLFDPPLWRPTVLAREPGGFISLCASGRAGRRRVVCSTGFKPVFQADACRILVLPLDGGECPRPVADVPLPFTHRVAACEAGGRACLLASTLCGGKAHRDDWTRPGGIHLAEPPEDLAGPWRFRPIVTGLNKNHGMDFARLGAGGAGGYLLSAMEGLFYLPIPLNPDGAWPIERIAEGEHSDAYAHDWAGDGRPVVFSLSPFHGNVLSLHAREGRGWRCEVIAEDLDFAHVLWAGTLLGRPALIAGGRGGRKELRLYRTPAAEPRGFRWEPIDEGIGAAQLAVVRQGDRRAALIVSGHACGQVLRYDLED